MKKIIILLFLSLTLSASQCKKENDCHYCINFINQSDKDVIFGLRFTDYEGNCRIDGKKVMKNETFDFQPYNSCIEDNLNSNTPLNIYLINSDNYNNSDVFYDCDSINIINEILKQYILTLDDLKNNNFKIVYP